MAASVALGILVREDRRVARRGEGVPSETADAPRSTPKVGAFGIGLVCAWLMALGAFELLLPQLVAWDRRLDSGFLWIHYLYLDLFLVVPACGLYLLATWRRRRPVALVLAALGLAWVPVLAYATFVEPHDLRIERVEVDLGRPGEPPLVVALLADLQARHVTGYEEAAVALALAEEPDLILIPGDWQHADSFEDYQANLRDFRALIAKLHAPLGVYIVQGNTEPPGGLERLTVGTGVEILDGRILDLEHGTRRIALGGLDLSGYRTDAGLQVVRALEGRDDADLRLLLSHKPDAVYALRPDSPIDLLLAGHTHGGQVQLPFFGPPITLSAVPRHVAAGGLHSLDGRRVYVSRGIGLERGPAPALRFLAPPELTILTIR